MDTMMSPQHAGLDNRQTSSLAVFVYSGLLLMYYSIPMVIYGHTLFGFSKRAGIDTGAGVLVWLPFLWLFIWSLAHRGRMLSRRAMVMSSSANVGVCVLWIGILAYYAHGARGGPSVWLPLLMCALSGGASLTGVVIRDMVRSYYLPYYLSYYPPVLFGVGVLWGTGLNLGSFVVTVAFIGVLCWDIETKLGRRQARREVRPGTWPGWLWIFRGWLAVGVAAGAMLAGLLAVNTMLPLPSQAQPNWAVTALNADSFLQGEYFVPTLGLCCIPVVWSVISLRRTKERIKHDRK